MAIALFYLPASRRVVCAQVLMLDAPDNQQR